jgi:phage antirepressor YoqD-like protein
MENARLNVKSKASAAGQGGAIVAQDRAAVQGVLAQLSGVVPRRNLVPLAPGVAPLTMSSREIAELTSKRHDNVMADCRAMLTELLGEGGVLKFQGTYVHPQNGQTYPCFNLPKDLTITLVSGYSVQMRHRIVTRWIELEARQQGAMSVLPHVLADRLRLAADQLDALQATIAEQQAVLEEQAPKVGFFDAVAEAGNAQTVEEVAHVLGTGRNRLFEFLRDERLLKIGNAPYQQYIDSGHFRVVEKQRYDEERGQHFTYTQTVVTGKGLALIQKRIASRGGDFGTPKPSRKGAR